MKQNRWSPFTSLWSPMQQFQSEVNRLFNRWADDNSLSTYPVLNVWEDGEHCFVEAELPGVELKDLDITVLSGNQLSIRGERKAVELQNGSWHRQERTFGKFSRDLVLPFLVDANQVEAKLEQGVLTIKLAKHASVKPRKVEIRT